MRAFAVLKVVTPIFCLALSVPAQADVAVTVTIQDSTDTVSVTQVPVLQPHYSCSSGGESVVCTEFPTGTGATFSSSTIRMGPYNFIEPGTTDTTSDEFFLSLTPYDNKVVFSFISDPDVNPYGGCTNPANTCAAEDGTVQTLGTITWSDGTVDTIKFQSDLDTPEPGSLTLLASGLLAVVGRMKRRIG